MIERLELSLDDLCAFLRRAKLATFAGEGPRSKRRFIRMYRYEEDDWTYEDRYTGNLLDTGMEIVRLSGYPIWAMVYRGGMLAEKRDTSQEGFGFLKEALRLAPIEMPVRGPDLYSRDEWQYINSVQGEVVEFTGLERILLSKQEVYRRLYQGGLVYDKKYTITIVKNHKGKNLT